MLCATLANNAAPAQPLRLPPQQRLNQPQQLPQRPAIAVNAIAADRPNAITLIRIRQQRSRAGAQLLSAMHHLSRAALDEQLRDIRTVAVVRARQDGQPQRGRLEQIVPPNGHQAPTHKRNISRRIKIQQLTERIDEQHVSRPGSHPGLLASSLRAPHEADPRALQPVRNLLKPRHMPRHYSQQRPRMRAAHNLVRFEDVLLLTSVSAPSHPHGPGGSIKLTQAPPPFANILRYAEIELDVARDMRAIGIRSQGHEATGINLSLGSHNRGPLQ